MGGLVALACAAPGAGTSGGSAAAVAGAGSAAGPEAAGADCDALPGRPVTVFLEGRTDDAPRRQVFGKVTFRGAAEPGTVPRYTFTDESGATHRLGYLDPSGPLPVVAGQTYDLTVEAVMGEPSPGALVLADGKGLLWAAAADTALGRSVMADGPPGFSVRLADGGCRSRKVTNCFASRVNQVLEVTHDGATVRLGHGQRARLGAYEVVCHAAEMVKYTSDCADAGVLAVSWTIRRVER